MLRRTAPSLCSAVSNGPQRRSFTRWRSWDGSARRVASLRKNKRGCVARLLILHDLNLTRNRIQLVT